MPENPEPYCFKFVPGVIRRRLKGRDNLYAILHNTGWLAADRVLRMGIGLIVGAWVVRYLGPTQYGELSYVIAFSTFFQVISMLGLDSVAIRDIAREKAASSIILGTVFRFRITSGLICWLAAIAIMAVFRNADRQILLLTAIVCGGFVFQAADTIDLWFQSQTKSKMTVLAKAMSYLLSNLLRIGLILTRAPLSYFAAALLAENVLSALALWYSYKKYPTSFSWTYDRHLGIRLIKESWPYLLSGLAIMVYMRLDQIMLREMLGTHELGIFTAAMPISTMWYFLPVMVAQSIGPAIAKKKQTDKIGYDHAIKRLYTMMWLVMLPLCMVVAILSVPLVYLLFGSAFNRSATVLSIHVFSCLPVALGSVQDLWNLNEKKNLLSLKKALAGMGINIVLNLVLIPRFGAVGAAIATVVSQSVYGVFANIILDPKVFRLQLSSFFGLKAFVASYSSGGRHFEKIQ